MARCRPVLFGITWGSLRGRRSSPVLSSLHWLPVSFRIDFKILLFVFKSLNGLAPTYLSELLCLHNPNRTLRSNNQLSLEIPRTRYKHRGDRVFSVNGPRLWNKLPADLRAIRDFGLFKSQIKTRLFKLAFNNQQFGNTLS